MLRIFCQLVISISVICKSLKFLVLPHFRPTYLIKYTPTQKMYEVGLSQSLYKSKSKSNPIVITSLVFDILFVMKIRQFFCENTKTGMLLHKQVDELNFTLLPKSFQLLYFLIQFPPFNSFRTFMYCDIWPYVL